MENKQICILIKALTFGGAEKQSLMLAKSLKGKYDTYLIVQEPEKAEETYLDFINKEKIKVLYLSGHFAGKLICLYKILREKKINIIISFLTSDNLLAAIAGKISKTKYIIGGIRNCLLPRFKFIITRFLHKYFQDYTIFNNYSGKESFISKGFEREKCIVLPNCIDLHKEFFQREQTSKINILTVGRFVKQKDLYTAIKSIHYLVYKKKFKNLTINYYIVGYGILLQSINNWIKQYELSDNVKIVIKPSDLSNYYILADIYLCTSLYEGLSNTIMEAMSHSLPIIATDAGDNRQLVDNNKNGFLVAKGDYIDIAEKLYRLMQSYELRIQYGKYSHNLIFKKYSFNNYKKNYFRFIENLI